MYSELFRLFSDIEESAWAEESGEGHTGDALQ